MLYILPPLEIYLLRLRQGGYVNSHFLSQEDIEIHLDEFSKKWPYVIMRENYQGTLGIIESMFGGNVKLDRPLSLHVSGTNFQISVWKALIEIRPGTVTSYSQIPSKIGRPHAARAVGTAIGANPVAFLIPCHRVIQQSGKLGGYHWGETRKHAIHAWESARYG